MFMIFESCIVMNKFVKLYSFLMNLLGLGDGISLILHKFTGHLISITLEITTSGATMLLPSLQTNPAKVMFALIKNKTIFFNKLFNLFY